MKKSYPEGGGGFASEAEYDAAYAESERTWDSRTRTFGEARAIKLKVDQGSIVFVDDEHDNGALLTVASPLGHATVKLTASQLWNLAEDITEWFGGKALTPDALHAHHAVLYDKIFAVFEKNEMRCLDDDIDRGVVVAELMKALT